MIANRQLPINATALPKSLCLAEVHANQLANNHRRSSAQCNALPMFASVKVDLYDKVMVVVIDSHDANMSLHNIIHLYPL